MHNLEAKMVSITARDAFNLYLRTGRRLPEHRILQVKFNPYHDPSNGRFTTGPGVTGGSSGAAASHSKTNSAIETYTVKAGDTLTHIAATRVGLTVEDLASLNGISPNGIIRPGQKLVLPTQAYLDRAKQGFDTANALDLYMQTHGGQLPPDVAHPPSVPEQMFGPGTREVVDNGYTFTIDKQGRTRLVGGIIALNPDQGRSQQNQLAAGGNDRLPTDQGGHYIARQFNGPTAAYNHFAQDADFNRSDYRKLEYLWSAATRRGEKVHVTIGSEYSGSSKRPSEISVFYTIAGLTRREDYPNQSGK